MIRVKKTALLSLFVALAGGAVVTNGQSLGAAPRPNILFAISDDQSFPHAGAYGCGWVKTPAFDRVAGDGLLFMNCYTPNAKCAPSRSCIVTGRNSWQLEAAGNHVCFFPQTFKTYSEALTATTDYFVGYTGKGVSPVVAGKRQLTGKAYHGVTLKPPAKAISNKDYAANFAQFMKEKPKGKPFCFWYGGHEPHRAYEYGAGVKYGGKSTDQVKTVPGFWPDNETVRTDMLDYAFEIEHFDRHLGRMLALLEQRGELDNTLVVVTADNGMPFPRCKGIEYEYSNHLPLAVMWPKGIVKAGRVITDYVSFIDFAPTFLELVGVDPAAAGMRSIQGRSLTPIFKSEKNGRVVPERNYVLLGQERHDVGRPNDVGYPVRSILREGMLYIHNFAPNRWPMCNPETGYLNTDGSPTKTTILDMRRQGDDKRFWDLCFGKHPPEELYDVRKDPECLVNLAASPERKPLMAKLKRQLFDELKAQGDPRMSGNGQVFDEYPYAGDAQRDFHGRYMRGEIKRFVTGWVNKSDFESKPLE